MYQLFLLVCSMTIFSVESWIPLGPLPLGPLPLGPLPLGPLPSSVDNTVIIHYNKYSIRNESSKFMVYNQDNKKVKSKITNNILWIKENSTNSMISQVKNINETPEFFEIPYSFETVFYSLFLSIPFSFIDEKFSTENLQTQVVEMNKKKLTILFEDTVDNKIINGKIEFFSPYFYKLSIREENKWQVHQSLFLIPTIKNKTRIIIYFTEKEYFLRYLKKRRKKYTKNTYLKIILKWTQRYNPNT